MFKKRQERKAIALIMAVAIMAVLAVIGFGFASSMKLESAATNAIRNLAQARLAAYAAIQLCQGALIDDAEATPSQTAGPLADHFNESLYQHPVPAAQETLLETGNLTVKATAASLPYYGGSGAGTVKIRDASSKMNLNAFGNLSKWYPDAGDYPNSVSTVTNAAESVYHGVNQRFSSFEVSFEEFFFYLYMTGGLWNTSWPSAVQLTYDAGNPNDADSKEARLRCANLARAICLYRYGPDAKPGFAGTDDDQDNHLLTADDIDNDGDSQNNEANEGVDEPDEYVPAKPYGDDTKFNYIAEFKDAIKATYSIGPGVPAAVGYASDADAEAERIYAVVRTELTLDSYTLDIRSACIDHPGYDGYDNDGDGMVDENETEDADGARTLAGLKAQITAGKTIYGTYNPGTGTFTDRIDICERGLEDSNAGRAAQAVYLHRKLRKVVQRFTLKNALDIVDYRDTDHVPTFISKADVFVLTDGNLNEDLYGMEGLHVTEVGRYIDVGANQFGSEVVPWTGNAGTCTYTVLVEHDEETERTSTLSITDAASLKQGDYIIKFQVQLPANGNGKLIVKNADGSLEKEITQNGTAYFGPLNVDNSGKGSIRVFANYLQGKVLNDIVGQTFTISDFHILLPYVEVMNWSKKDIDMADLYVYVGSEEAGGLNDGDPSLVLLNTGTIKNTSNPPAYKVPITAAPANHIPGQRPLLSGFSATHGGGYGFFVITYDEGSFERNFTGGGNQDGIWGNVAGEDFPIWTIGASADYTSDSKNPFYFGYDGSQQVLLLVREGQNTYKIIAGGVLDGFTGAGGTEKPLSTTNLALDRTLLFGNPWYSQSVYTAWALDKWTKDVVDESTHVARVSPGRWNRVDHAFGANYWPYDPDVFATGTDGRNDLPVIADRGYFVSPAEISNVSAGEFKNATFNYEQISGHAAYFPDWNPLIAYAVSARTPARVNLNTASAPVMAAAAVGLMPDAATLITLRENNRLYQAKELCETKAIKDVYYDDQPGGSYDDDDDDSAVRDFSERELWLIKNSSVFTLRGNVFSVACAGAVTDASGNTRALHSLEAVFDRGKAVREEAGQYRPVVTLVRVAPVLGQ